MGGDVGLHYFLALSVNLLAELLGFRCVIAGVNVLQALLNCWRLLLHMLLHRLLGHLRLLFFRRALQRRHKVIVEGPAWSSRLGSALRLCWLWLRRRRGSHWCSGLWGGWLCRCR